MTHTIRYRFFLRDVEGRPTSQHDLSPWTVGTWRETNGVGSLCGPGWLHAYESPELAEFHDPIHGNYGPSAELWRVECAGRELRDGAMKCGWSRMQPVESIERSIPTLEQRVRYAILCAMATLPDEPRDSVWRRWAEDWLAGRDRTATTARETVWQAHGLALAARKANWSAEAAAETAAEIESKAAVATEVAAKTVAEAAEAAAQAAGIDLAAIARRAMGAQL